MNSAHVTDSTNNQKAMQASDQYAKNSAESTAKTIAVIAALLKMLTKVSLEGVKNIFSRGDRSKNKDNSLIDQISDYLPKKNKQGLGKSKSLRQRLGNKTRGLTRGLKGKSLTKVATKGSKVAKATRFAKTARMAKNAGTVIKTGKVANTAYKAAKVAKLANMGRIAATGGVALAGGPVGVGLLVASVVAPIAIEAIWKNREQIYEGGKDLVTKSKLTASNISEIISAKNTKEGDIVPNGKGKELLLKGDDQSTLLETDGDGKVITNNFTPEQKLAFYQEAQGQKSMLLDETDLFPASETGSQVVTPEIATQESSATISQNNVNTATTTQIPNANFLASNQTPMPESQSGTSIISNTLGSLAQNNPNNPEIQQQTKFLDNNLQQSKVNAQSPGIKGSIKLNEAGSSIINLFNSQLPPEKRNQTLETKDYSISRRGNDYFLKDKEDKLLLQASNTGFGTKIKQSNLSPEQQEDLNYLKQDLRLNEGLTGGFVPVSQSTIPSETEQKTTLNTPNSRESSQNSISTTKESEKQSAFSQYLTKEEKIPAYSGHSSEESNDMER